MYTHKYGYILNIKVFFEFASEECGIKPRGPQWQSGRNHLYSSCSWWRHQMEIFSALLAIWAGNSPAQRPVTWSFDVYFDLRPNKRLSKQSLGWWFETLLPPLLRHRNVLSSSNRKYPPFPLLSHFSVFVCMRYLLHHILSLIAYTFRENREFVFIIIVQFMMSANNRIRFGLQTVLVCLYSILSHYHHCAYLSEGIELIKCLSDIFCRVCE